MNNHTKNDLGFPSSVGYLKNINFNRFVDLIPKKYINYNHQCNNHQILCYRFSHEYGKVINSGSILCFEDKPEEVLVELVTPSSYNIDNKFSIIRYFLLEEAKMIDISNNNLKEFINKASDNYFHEGETPTHLVKVSHRLWMVANPKNFTIYITRDRKIGLFIDQKKFNIVYSIHKGEPKTFRMLGQN